MYEVTDEDIGVVLSHRTSRVILFNLAKVHSSPTNSQHLKHHNGNQLILNRFLRFSMLSSRSPVLSSPTHGFKTTRSIFLRFSYLLTCVVL